MCFSEAEVATLYVHALYKLHHGIAHVARDVENIKASVSTRARTQRGSTSTRATHPFAEQLALAPYGTKQTEETNRFMVYLSQKTVSNGPQ